jgi:uncharacterized protein YjbI with pentapeptide repeats
MSTPEVPSADPGAHNERAVSFTPDPPPLPRQGSPGLRDRVASGEQLWFDGTEPLDTRCIEAAWLHEAVTKNRPISLRSCIILGDVELRDKTITDRVEFVNCRFTGCVDFSRTGFSRLLRLEGTEFLLGACFAGARFDGDVLMQRACFRQGVAAFENAAFKGDFDASFAQLDPGVGADFARSSFEAVANFTSVKFGGPMKMSGARCGRHLSFESASFADAAAFPTVAVAGVALFEKAQFQGAARADFSLLSVDGLAAFEGVTFSAGADFTESHMGSADFSKVTCQQPLVFDRIEVGNSLDLTGSTLETTGEDQSHALQLNGARIAKDASLDGIRIVGDLQAIGMRVGDLLEFRDAVVTGNADFFETSVERGAFFKGSEFQSDVIFATTRFDELWLGDGTKAAAFYGLADFSGMSTEQLFSLKVNFASPNDDIRFDFTKFGRVADFSGSTFEGRASFQGASFGGRCNLDSTTFSCERKEALFQDAVFSRGMQCRGATFAKGANFSQSTFGGKALFRARFDGAAVFDACVFDGSADFSSADDGSAEPMPEGDTSELERGTRFTTLSLCQVRCRGQLRLQSAQFHGDVNLQGAELSSLLLPVHSISQDDPRLPEKIDMRGCRFDQLGLDWRAFRFRRGTPTWWRARFQRRHARVSPYDRASYARLESAFRRTGDDRVANRIRLERHRIERGHMLERHTVGDWGSWLLSALYLLVANYGVRPLRLLVYTLVLLTLGTAYFHAPGTVEPKDEKIREQTLAKADTAHQLSGIEAFGVTLNYFLPGNVPLSDEWRPLARHKDITIHVVNRDVRLHLRPATVATILKICGWILVPFGIGAVTGLLRRPSAT